MIKYTKQKHEPLPEINVYGFGIENLDSWIQSRFVLQHEMTISEKELMDITTQWEYISLEERIEVTQFYLDYCKLMGWYESRYIVIALEIAMLLGTLQRG